jgi:hypothetical protein
LYTSDFILYVNIILVYLFTCCCNSAPSRTELFLEMFGLAAGDGVCLTEGIALKMLKVGHLKNSRTSLFSPNVLFNFASIWSCRAACSRRWNSELVPARH